MEAPLDHPAEEIKRLRRCINDLVGVLALSAVWTGSEPSQIVSSLIDALLGMLSLDLIYVRLNGRAGETPLEIVRGAPSLKMTRQPQAIGEMLEQWFGSDLERWPPVIRNQIGDGGDISIVPLMLGLQGEVGLIAAGSQRADFPRQTERLLLSVAANQAVIGLQEARLLSEQKRVANELDKRVAQRTMQLAAANEKLKKEESELKRSEARKAAILDSALDCIITIDHEGRINEFNLAAERTFGYKRDEVVGKPLTDAIIPPSLREKHRRGLARYLETGEVVVLGRRLETTAVRADGSEFPVELTITRIPVDGPPSFTGCLRDITERKQSQEELRRSEAFLAEAQHLSSTGSFSWCVATGEITWSRQLYCIFEFDQDIPVTLDLVLTRVHPEDISALHDLVRWGRGTGGDYEFEYRLQLPDQSVKYLHVAAHGSRDEEGRLVNVVGAVQDVTERQLAEQELNEVRSELARAVRAMSLGVATASIAHEVNQPLAGIVTNASTCLRMLAADPPNIDGARETARRTIRDANRASDVVTRLRALFAKKEAPAELVDLNEAAREVIALSLTELQRARIILQAKFADDLPPVTGDRVQLQQVILNLVRNACDAMRDIDDRPRQLVIGTDLDEGDRVRLTVRDAGVGFDPRSVNRLFEAFYSTKRDGMGIGLSVSRSIIESHHGRLCAAPNDGPGATFSFSIPLYPQGSPGMHTLGDIPSLAATNGRGTLRSS
jgi:PAS domain S-box-containing protein